MVVDKSMWLCTFWIVAHPSICSTLCKEVLITRHGLSVTGASCQRQGKYKDAIKYHSLVLSISERTKEHSGNTEAYGAIADCYTELGDLESAGKFYDQYIGRLEKDEVD